jgi:hypothetical protein
VTLLCLVSAGTDDGTTAAAAVRSPISLATKLEERFEQFRSPRRFLTMQDGREPERRRARRFRLSVSSSNSFVCGGAPRARPCRSSKSYA